MKPFDLEAAKRGDPIVCRDGTPVKFIAHVPEAHKDARVLYLFNEWVYVANESGTFQNQAERSLFMAPKKRTVWVNLFPSGNDCHYETEEDANRMIPKTDKRLGGKAYPVEIEE